MPTNSYYYCLVSHGGKAHLLGDDDRTLCGLGWEDHPEFLYWQIDKEEEPPRPMCKRCMQIEVRHAPQP